MKWLLENPWVFIVIAGVVVQVLKALRRTPEAGDAAAPPKEYEFDDPALAERTRRIREEIRRKIEERRGQDAAPPVLERPPLARTDRSPEATPPPVVIELPEVIREVFAPRPPERAPVATAPADRAAQLYAAEETERQRSLNLQLQDALDQQQAAERRVRFEQTTADPEPAARDLVRAAVLEDLRDPAALRRAFLLREVIGPPVALR